MAKKKKKKKQLSFKGIAKTGIEVGGSQVVLGATSQLGASVGGTAGRIFNRATMPIMQVGVLKKTAKDLDLI